MPETHPAKWDIPFSVQDQEASQDSLTLVRNDPSHSPSLSYPAIDAHNFDEEAGFPFLIGVGGVGVPNLQFMQTVASLQQSTPLKLRSTQPPPLPPHWMI